MTSADSPRRNSAPPDHFTAHTRGGIEAWAFQSLHREAPAGDVRQQLERGCIDTYACIPALVNGRPCVVIEQELQARDSCDDWPELAADGLVRLKQHLLPKLVDSAEQADGAEIGVIADARVTYRGRPTVFAALPASVRPETVRGVPTCLRDFAYPLRIEGAPSRVQADGAPRPMRQPRFFLT